MRHGENRSVGLTKNLRRDCCAPSTGAASARITAEVGVDCEENESGGENRKSDQRPCEPDQVVATGEFDPFGFEGANHEVTLSLLPVMEKKACSRSAEAARSSRSTMFSAQANRLSSTVHSTGASISMAPLTRVVW